MRNSPGPGQTAPSFGCTYYNSPLPTPLRTDPDYQRKEQERRRQQKFFDALRYAPNLTFRRGRLQRLRGGALVEKKVDVMLATDLIMLAVNDVYDVAIIVSCDADYAYAIEAVKHHRGKRIELATVVGSKSYELRTVCDDYIPIDDAVIVRSLHA